MKHSCLLFVFSESIWTTPKEGYMTIEEYNRLNLVYNAKAEQQLHQESKFMRENADELVSKYRREQLKVFRSETTAKEEEEKEIERETYEEYEEPGTSAKPYGRWQSVVQKYDILIIFFSNSIVFIICVSYVHLGWRNQLIYSYQLQPKKSISMYLPLR